LTIEPLFWPDMNGQTALQAKKMISSSFLSVNDQSSADMSASHAIFTPPPLL
jgi:hypothetical protein